MPFDKPVSARRVLRSTLVLCFVSTAAMAHAGGAGIYRLDWPYRGEVLNYRSCGCADACWVAEVRIQRTKALKARLRCDCESLRYARSPSLSKETALGNCETINRSGSKPEAIREKLEQILHPTGAHRGLASSAP